MEFDWIDTPFDLKALPPKEIEESFEDPFSLRILPDMVRKQVTPTAVTAAQAAVLVQETCVAECVHCWLVVLSVGMLFLWKSVWSWALWLVYNLLGNVSFILIQRYNRPRLLRLAEKENKKRL